MISRLRYVRRLVTLLRRYPVVAIIGARQTGKTTLAMEVARRRRRVTVFDLENPRDLDRIADPLTALERLRGLVVIDEVQHAPDLFKVLRVLADRPGKPARFLVLGSASPGLLKQTSESLAGRIAYHVLNGLDLDEVGPENMARLWCRGGFPPSYTARSPKESSDWREWFIGTFLERDIPQLGITIPAITLRRFWTMVAHYHGQTWNSSEFARAFGVTDKTIRNYLDILTSTFAVRQLQPWSENIKKRQVKAPKVYIADSGVLHALLGIPTEDALAGHPKVGASWEGFALGQIIQRLNAPSHDCYFWATHTGAELDLLVRHGNRRYGFEFKRTSAPGFTPSMRNALKDLGLDRIDVVYPGAETYPLTDKIRAVGLPRILKDIKPLR